MEGLGDQPVTDRDQATPHGPAPGVDVGVDLLGPQKIEEGVCCRHHGGLPPLADRALHCDALGGPGQGLGPTGFAPRTRCRLNRPVTEPARDTSYRLAPALGIRLVGRSLVTLGVLVVVATLGGLLTGAGWAPAGVLTVVGLVVVAVWAWWLLRRARALRLTADGYAVRLLAGVGAAAAPWSRVEEVVAASPGGERCLVLTLSDGRTTRLPMAALAADPDTVAVDVRRRVRDAHMSPDPDPKAPPGDHPA